jgi:serine/threonine protein kinase
MLVLYEDMKFKSIFYLDKSEIVDFICMRKKFIVFKNLKNHAEFDKFGYLFFLYLCKLHNNNLFHGDVKPDNLFEFRDMISSDAGTLLILDPDNNKA